MTVAHSRSTVEHLARPGTRGIGLDVFAVEDRSAQVLWSDLPACRVTVTCRRDDRVVWQRTLDHLGGPGAVELTELLPESRHEVELHSSDGHHARRDLRTLATPPGEELFRFATLNDLHLGREDKRGTDRLGARPGVLTPQDMARDALTDALAWGASTIVVKGDVCDQSFDRYWDQALSLFAAVPVPVWMLPGNHDTGTRRAVEPDVAARLRGLRMIRGVEHLDVDGLRIVLVESGIPDGGWGDIARHRHDVADLVADARAAGTGTFIGTHHQPQRFRTPLYWPHGTPGPNAGEFARTVRAADAGVMVSSGHTHRCRRRDVAGVPWTEVASTHHFPATWAGYRVFEGGLMQVVRRTAVPGALAWSETTRDALGGIWALWATGTLSDRSFALDWRRLR